MTNLWEWGERSGTNQGANLHRRRKIGVSLYSRVNSTGGETDVYGGGIVKPELGMRLFYYVFVNQDDGASSFSSN